MKRDGTHNLFKPSDVTRYPFFYVEMTYAISTIVGTVIYAIHANGDFEAKVPEGASAAWQTAASEVGILVLLCVALGTAFIGLYGLFKGGFKWRATHMFLQFLLRLYTVVGALSIYGLWPTTWLSNAVLTIVAGIVYLKLRMEQRTFENGY